MVEHTLSHHSFSPELTFIPRRAPYQIVHDSGHKSSVHLMRGIERGLLTTFDDLELTAKFDWFHFGAAGTMPGSMCVEIVPRSRWTASRLNDPKQLALIDRLFAWLRTRWGLVPSVIKRRNGREHHLATGGCHVHWDSNLIYSRSLDWYDQMKRFNRNLVIDYANNPWIRWLFAQWFDDRNSEIVLNRNHLRDTDREALTVLATTRLTCGINPRFFSTAKPSHATFELRVFNMVESANELRLYALFVEHWMNWHARNATSAESKTLAVTLRPHHWRTFRDPRKAWRRIAKWLDTHDLPSKDYRLFFERNYLYRLRYGQLV